MSTTNPKQKVSLKDRIAAIEQRNASSSPGSGNSLSPPVSHQSGLRDRIAKFESKGGVPIPRGSFGMGAPPPEEALLRKRGELYGNRIPSVPGVQPGARLVMNHTGSAVPSTSVPPFLNKANRRFSASIEFNNLPKFDPTMGPSPADSSSPPPLDLPPSSPPLAVVPSMVKEVTEPITSQAPSENGSPEQSGVPPTVISPPIVISSADPPEPTFETVEPNAEPTVTDTPVDFPVADVEPVEPNTTAQAMKPVMQETASNAAIESRELAISPEQKSPTTLDEDDTHARNTIPVSPKTPLEVTRPSEPTSSSEIPSVAADPVVPADDNSVQPQVEVKGASSSDPSAEDVDSVSSPPSARQIASLAYDNAQVLEVPLTPSSTLTPSPMSIASFNTATVEATAERFSPITGRGVPVFIPGTHRAKSDFFTPESVNLSEPHAHKQTHSLSQPATTAPAPRGSLGSRNPSRANASTYSVIVRKKAKELSSSPEESKPLPITPMTPTAPMKHAGLPPKPETPMSPGFQDLALLMQDTSRLEQLLSGGFSDHQLPPLTLPDEKEEVVAFEGPQPASLDIASLANRPIKKKRSLKSALGRSKSSSSQSTLTGVAPPLPSTTSDNDRTRPSMGAHQRRSTTSEVQIMTSEFSDSASEVAPTPPPKSGSKRYFSSLRRLGSQATRSSSKHTSVSSSSVEDSPQLLTPADDTAEFGSRQSRPSSVYGFPSNASWSSLSPKKSKNGGMLRTTSLAEKWNRVRTKSNVSSIDVPSEDDRRSIVLPALTLLPPLESVTPRSSSEFAVQQQQPADFLSTPPPRFSSLKTSADSPPEVRRASIMSEDTSFSSIAPTPIDPSFFDSFPPVPQTMPNSRLSTAGSNTQ